MQATIVWLPEGTCTTFEVAKNHARSIKFHQKCFIESILFERVNPDGISSNKQNYNNIKDIEIELTRFEIYPETEVACKYPKPFCETQYSENLVEYEKGFNMKTGKLVDDPAHPYRNCKDEKSYVLVKFYKNTVNLGGKLRPEDKDSTRLKELSIMINQFFGAIPCNIHLDMKLDYTISQIVQEVSLSEIETLHRLCELERTQIIQSVAVAVIKIPFLGYLLSGKSSNFIKYEGNNSWYYKCTKQFHRYMVSKIKDVTNGSLFFIKLNYVL